MIIKETRGGRYLRQIGGYTAFRPKPLPPEPSLDMDDALWTALSKADRALGRLDGTMETLPNPDLFVLMYVRKEAVLSSQIEGTQASLTDVLEVEAETLENHHPKDVAEVINYIEAMNHGLAELQTLPISNRLIRSIHQRLLQGVRGGELNPGEFRRSQNWIGPSGTNIEDAIFIPPPPHIVEECMAELEQFIHSDSPLPVLVKAGLIHSQFETIHPFLDGNGRIGRLLITFFLCGQSVLRKPLLYLSHHFKKNRLEYYQRLQAVRDNGDYEGWLKFFLNGVALVSNQATEVGREIVALRENHRQLILNSFGRSAHNGLLLLEYLFQAPVVTVAKAAQVINVSYANVNNIVSGLEAIGIVTEVTGRRRNRVFRYTAYIDLFERK